MGHGLFVMTDLYNDNKYICIYIIYIYNICLNVANRPSADGLHTFSHIIYIYILPHIRVFMPYNYII